MLLLFLKKYRTKAVFDFILCFLALKTKRKSFAVNKLIVNLHLD